MDILFSIATGLGLRVICINLPDPVNKLAPAFVGLWEGIISQLIVSLNPEGRRLTIDHYLAYSLRLVFDLILAHDFSRPISVALWTAVGVLVCQTVGPISQPDTNKLRRRRRRHKVTHLVPLPSHICIYKSPPNPRPQTGSATESALIPPRRETPLPDQPVTPPSFFLQGEDSGDLNFSPLPVNQPTPSNVCSPVPPRPPSALAPLLEAPSDEDTAPRNAALLPTPPATSLSVDTDDKNPNDIEQRLSTIAEASSGEEAFSSAVVGNGAPNKDYHSTPNINVVEDTELEQAKKPNATSSPSMTTMAPLPVPDPYVRQSLQKMTRAGSEVCCQANQPSLISVPYFDNPTTKFVLRLSTPGDEVLSDELQTPLNPIVRTMFDDDINNIYTENENDELQTPLALNKHLAAEQLSPLLLPVRLRLGIPPEDMRHAELGDDDDQGFDQLAMLNPPPGVVAERIDTITTEPANPATSASHDTAADVPRLLNNLPLQMLFDSMPTSPGSESGLSVLSTAVPSKLYSRGGDWRKRAWEEEKNRSDLAREYELALKERRATTAFMLKGRIAEMDAKIKRLHEKAARRYYMSRNMTQRAQTVDVHGLRVIEAIEVTENAFREALASGHGTLRVITGKGLHSKNNQPVIKNALIKTMERQKIPCKPDPTNSGILILSLPPP
ncbi:hypothetical protein AX17_005741 [Amanita inopinata Kibby_2008]|nr:hypothetical protein AX17_005741 [Amanita inopinata Kibby_2008]